MRGKGFFEKLKNARQQKLDSINTRKESKKQENNNRSKYYYCINCDNSSIIAYSFKANE